MAIVIKDMKMPETCGKCPFCVRHDTYYDICCITDDLIWYGEREQKKATCPLVEIPDTFFEKYQELMKKHPDTKQFALLPFQEREVKE